MTDITMHSVLAQMRAMKSRAQGFDAIAENSVGQVNGTKSDFSTMIKSAVDQVNESQKTAGDLKTKFETGVNVNLSDVMIASQKAKVEFEATVQVRNKVVEAYQTIMNMPI